jgi:hypothetical protein
VCRGALLEMLDRLFKEFLLVGQPQDPDISSLRHTVEEPFDHGLGLARPGRKDDQS